MPNSIMYRMGGMTDIYRMNTLSADITDTDLSDLSPTPLIYILITGASASVTAVRIEISYVFEFVPVNANYIFCNVAPSPPGSMTLAFLANLYKMFPNL